MGNKKNYKRQMRSLMIEEQNLKNDQITVINKTMWEKLKQFKVE